ACTDIEKHGPAEERPGPPNRPLGRTYSRWEGPGQPPGGHLPRDARAVRHGPLPGGRAGAGESAPGGRAARPGRRAAGPRAAEPRGPGPPSREARGRSTAARACAALLSLPGRAPPAAGWAVALLQPDLQTADGGPHALAVRVVGQRAGRAPGPAQMGAGGVGAAQPGVVGGQAQVQGRVEGAHLARVPEAVRTVA